MTKNDSKRDRITHVTWGEIRETVCDADELARIERRNEVMRKILSRKHKMTISANNKNSYETKL